MNANSIKRDGSNNSGFSIVELGIASAVTAMLLLSAVGLQKAASDSFRTNEVAAQPLDELSRIGDRIDRELRAASAGTLEVPGSPFPSAPTSGTAYNSMSYRRVLYNPTGGGSSATYQEANYDTIALSGTNLELTTAGGTVVIAQGITNFSLVWDSLTRCVAVTLGVQRIAPGGIPITKTITKNVYLRNT